MLLMILQRAKASRQSAALPSMNAATPPRPANRFFSAKRCPVFVSNLTKSSPPTSGSARTFPGVDRGRNRTGKTSIARWLYHHGPRAAGPLVEVNCPALPESLAESELFGHERGAFTDAKSARMGLFEAAKRGTLFPDELASLSLGLQAKVLKAIEDRRIRRLGGNREIEVDVRIIAASNRDLGQAVEAGEFATISITGSVCSD